LKRMRTGRISRQSEGSGPPASLRFFVRPIMRTIWILSCILVLAGFVGAQVFLTNSVSRAEAIKVASQLKVDMREEDAGSFLAKHGLTNSMSVGAAGGWGRFYQLTDGSSLMLDYTARELALNGHWGGNGLLQKAFIQSNGSNIVSIPLRRRP
jgi:hypothetical protein